MVLQSLPWWTLRHSELLSGTFSGLGGRNLKICGQGHGILALTVVAES